MNRKYRLGDKFKTGMELSFKGFFIPKGTDFEILEKLECYNAYKVYFYSRSNPEHEECIQILEREEIEDIQDLVSDKDTNSEDISLICNNNNYRGYTKVFVSYDWLKNKLKDVVFYPGNPDFYKNTSPENFATSCLLSEADIIFEQASLDNAVVKYKAL